MAAPMLEFQTPGFSPYAVKYSPYYEDRVAVAASANYGIVGNGRVYVLGLDARGIHEVKHFDTNDAQYDLAWSELNENQLLVACGDGSVKLFDVGVADFPVMNFHEHRRECFSVAWNPTTRDSFLSSSWDGSVRVWSPTRRESLRVLPCTTPGGGGASCTYSAAFCPQDPSLISAASSDGNVRLFDLRTPSSARYHLVATVEVSDHGGPGGIGNKAPPSEVLTHDWNKYRPRVVATGGVDRVVRTFDLRSPAAGPLAVMPGHEYAVRRLVWSPHAADTIVTASYDMTVRLWNDASSEPPPPAPAAVARLGSEIGRINRHTEFVAGVDWCLFGTGTWVASCGWDQRVLLWDADSFLKAQRRQ